MADWQELTDLTRGHVFVAAFVRSHGSIKEMERIFGVSCGTALLGLLCGLRGAR